MKRGERVPIELWAKIKSYYHRGLSVSELAKGFSVTRKSIYDKIKKDGWKRNRIKDLIYRFRKNL